MAAVIWSTVIAPALANSVVPVDVNSSSSAPESWNPPTAVAPRPIPPPSESEMLIVVALIAAPITTSPAVMFSVLLVALMVPAAALVNVPVPSSSLSASMVTVPNVAVTALLIVIPALA